MTPLPGILDTRDRPLDAWLEEIGEPPYRARQIRRWVFGRGARSFREMTDLSKPLRERLESERAVFASRIVETSGEGDETTKLLIELADGETIEAVLIREGSRSTACVSTQVGCPVGCPFCASGLAGTRRNLHAHEIVEEILMLRALAEESGGLTHLVFMGIGEPLLNYEALESALRTLHAEDGLGMASRRITLSTVAPRGKIPRLERLPLPINLAISLHAPNDEIRDRLVPGNGGVDELIRAATGYHRRTGRQVTFEYVLLAGVNDGETHARELSERLSGTGCSVNLIPFNPVPGTGFHPPESADVTRFRDVLDERGIAVTIRKRKGRAIEAACGQLRWNRMQGSATPPRRGEDQAS